MSINKNRFRIFWARATPFLSWGLGGLLFLMVVLAGNSIIPLSIKHPDLSSNIALITQVLSVLVGFAFVGATLYLSTYGNSDTTSKLLKRTSDNSAQLTLTYFEHGSEQRKLTNVRFVKSLFRRSRIDRLHFNDPKVDEYSEFYVFRPYWDGVWYQVYFSPFEDGNRTWAQLASIQALHETVICAAKILGIIHELRAAKLNLVSHKSGTQGSRGFIKRLDTITTDFRSLKRGRTPDQMRLHDALQVVAIAINSEHYMSDELNRYAEEVDWDPYESAYFQVVSNEYIAWMAYLLIHLQQLRVSIVNERKICVADELSKGMIKRLDFELLSKIKQEAFDVRKEAINALGVTRRYKDIRLAAIPGIGTGIIALLLILLLWPASMAIDNPEKLRLLFSVLMGLGVLGTMKSGEFVVLMLLGSLRRVNRTPMGKIG